MLQPSFDSSLTGGAPGHTVPQDKKVPESSKESLISPKGGPWTPPPTPFSPPQDT